MKVLSAERTKEVRHANRDLVPIAKEVEKQGKILYMNTGDPIGFDFRAPDHLWDAILASKKTCEGYTNAIGTDAAREAVASYAKKSGASTSKEDVICFVGGSEGILLSMQALLNKGDNVLLPKPGYSVYNGELAFLESPINEYSLEEENDWQVDLESLRKGINEKTKGIVVINPNNPTGGMLSQKNLQGVIDIAGEHNLPVISDETYDQIVLDEVPFTSAASLAKDVPVLSLGSISKTYLLPGFRGAWIYKHDPENALDDYFEGIKRLCRLRLSNSGPAMVALEAALNGPKDHIQDMVSKLKSRRNFAYKRLSEMEGISCVKPKGAFYAFPKLEFALESDKDFVVSLLKEERVLVTHGSGFGQKDGTHHFRLVLLPPEELLSEALGKIESFINRNYLK